MAHFSFFSILMILFYFKKIGIQLKRLVSTEEQARELYYKKKTKDKPSQNAFVSFRGGFVLTLNAFRFHLLI